MRLPPALLGAACLFWLGTARAESVRIEPSADNTLFEDADGDTSDGAGPALFVGKNNQNAGRARRGLIAFDLSAIPRSASIDSVVLVLRVSNSSDLVPRIVTLHRATSAWGEGASFADGGAGAQAMTGDASWTCAFFPDRLWHEPGGDFESLPSASQIVGSVGAFEWSGLGLVADVAGWLEQPTTNFGWLVRGDESGPGTARRFDSRENPEPDNRPSLTIHYSLSRSARAETWGSIKAAYR